MGKAIGAAFWIIVLLLGLAWAVSVVNAEFSCHFIFPKMLPACPHGGGDVWMLPMFTAPLGFPLFIAGVITMLTALVPKRRQ